MKTTLDRTGCQITLDKWNLLSVCHLKIKRAAAVTTLSWLETEKTYTYTDGRLPEGGHWHGLLSQAHASICHCYAKHCFGIEEIELRSRPAAVLSLSFPSAWSETHWAPTNRGSESHVTLGRQSFPEHSIMDSLLAVMSVIYSAFWNQFFFIFLFNCYLKSHDLTR